MTFLEIFRGKRSRVGGQPHQEAWSTWYGCLRSLQTPKPSGVTWRHMYGTCVLKLETASKRTPRRRGPAGWRPRCGEDVLLPTLVCGFNTGLFRAPAGSCRHQQVDSKIHIKRQRKGVATRFWGRRLQVEESQHLTVRLAVLFLRPRPCLAEGDPSI